jgi:hypothetical protein
MLAHVKIAFEANVQWHDAQMVTKLVKLVKLNMKTGRIKG